MRLSALEGLCGLCGRAWRARLRVVPIETIVRVETIMLFEVNFWASHPSEENDDCSCGIDCNSLEDAKACYDSPVPPLYVNSTAFVELKGPGVYEVRANPSHIADMPDNDDDWRRECAMQSAMCNGCAGWNDYYG